MTEHTPATDVPGPLPAPGIGNFPDAPDYLRTRGWADEDDRGGNVDVLPCQRDPELFFAESPRMLEQARGLCAECPVQELCLAGALDRREPYGVWGGQILLDGVVVATKRGRGRPRKTAA
jgi:WhiB family redox-sensing transcriptional regulator